MNQALTGRSRRRRRGSTRRSRPARGPSASTSSRRRTSRIIGVRSHSAASSSSEGTSRPSRGHVREPGVRAEACVVTGTGFARGATGAHAVASATRTSAPRARLAVRAARGVGLGAPSRPASVRVHGRSPGTRRRARDEEGRGVDVADQLARRVDLDRLARADVAVNDAPANDDRRHVDPAWISAPSPMISVSSLFDPPLERVVDGTRPSRSTACLRKRVPRPRRAVISRGGESVHRLPVAASPQDGNGVAIEAETTGGVPHVVTQLSRVLYFHE